MTQSDAAQRFAALHVKGKPLVLYNAWDAGSARTVAEQGATAIATSSWAVAQSQGYGDGQQIPVDRLFDVIERIARQASVPVSVDFEAGYTTDDEVLAEYVGRLIDLGVVGINFEDRVIDGEGLHAPEHHARRIGVVRAAADKRGAGFFINARTDVFFGSNTDHASLLGEAVRRAGVYADAGASGLFAPGLVDDALIKQLTSTVALPVNVLVGGGLATVEQLAKLGVARLSYGALPYINAMKDVGEQARTALGEK